MNESTGSETFSRVDRRTFIKAVGTLAVVGAGRS
jgi:hypothetical protein